MLAALMDKRITVEKKTNTKNSFGASEQTWSTLKVIWSSKKHLSGNKTFNDGDLTTLAVQWLCRYDPEIDMNCRIIEGSSVYEITEIEEVGRKAEMRIRTERNG